MSDRLDVYLHDHNAGLLTIDGPLRSPEEWAFTYAPDYLARPDSVALSASLPLRETRFEGAVVRNWFCNLLPEGAVRTAISNRLRLPVWDDFGLLAAIGGECAGAVSLHGPGATTAAVLPPLDSLSDMTLSDMDDGAQEGGFALLGTPLRLSLAGAQDKIAIVLDASGALRLPAFDEPSSHILKPDSFRFRHLCDLEAFGLALAAAVGLSVASARLVVIGGDRRALLVERYDRAQAPTGGLMRLHQEDFCQALGYPPELKYQAQGGPSLVQCLELVRRLRLGPVALQGLLDWVVFNALIGNADAHAKNLALLCGRDRRWRLAPFYDLVPTMALPERLVERSPALRIGNAARIDAVTADDWREFAGEAGFAAQLVAARVEALSGQVLVQAGATRDRLISEGGDAAELGRVAALVEANARRMAQSAGN